MNENVFRKVERLKEELLFQMNKKRFLKDIGASTETKKVEERSDYLRAERSFDIAETTIAIKGSSKPLTYSDAIRPVEVDILIGNSSKAEKVPGWPRTGFEDLVRILVEVDIRRLERSQ